MFIIKVISMIDDIIPESKGFVDFALDVLYKAGHIADKVALSSNRAIDQVIYEDSNVDLLLTVDDMKVLKQVITVSKLAQVFEELCIYSIYMQAAISFEQEKAQHIHSLLHYYWNNKYSIVIFGNYDHFSFSFANSVNDEYYASEWFENTNDRIYDIIDRIDVANITINNSRDYFYDFVYSIVEHNFAGSEDIAVSKSLISSLEKKNVMECRVKLDTHLRPRPKKSNDIDLLSSLLDLDTAVNNSPEIILKPNCAIKYNFSTPSDVLNYIEQEESEVASNDQTINYDNVVKPLNESSETHHEGVIDRKKIISNIRKIRILNIN